MDKEQVQTEITLSDIWNKLLKHKFLIISITLAFAILTFLIVFTYNKRNRIIVNEFTYHFEGVDKEQYPDGSVFDFIELSEINFLTTVKRKNNEFKEIDLDKLIANSNFKFMIVEKRVANTENEFKTHFRIEMPIRAFKNQLLAEMFLKEFHKTLLDKVIEKNSALKIINHFDFNSYDNFAKNRTYENIINLFALQNKILTEAGKTFLKNHSQVNTTVNNVSYNLDNFMQNYELWYKDNVNPNQLLQEVYENGYIRNIDETIRISQARLIEVEREISLNKNLIRELHDMSLSLGLPGNSESDVFYREIEKLIIENSKLEVEKSDLLKLIANTEPNIDPVFDNQIKETALQIRCYVNTYNLIVNNYLNDHAGYRRVKTHDYTIENPLNLLTISALFGLAGLAVSSVISLSLKDKEQII